MNKIVEKDTNLYIEKNEESVSIDVNAGCQVTVYHFVVDRDVNIAVHLNSENACIQYFFSHLNYEDHQVKVQVFHHASKTTSNFYNHGVNILDHKLRFFVNGIVPKEMSGCICNQENQIIHLKNGKSTICPNLLIDCYDVISNHSAYIGKFQKEQLFYLKSRGLSEEQSYRLLMKGFLVPGFVIESYAKECLLEIENI